MRTSYEQLDLLSPATDARSEPHLPPGVAAPPVIQGATYRIAATLGRRAIAFAMTGAADKGERWHEERSRPVVMREGGTTAEVVLVRVMDGQTLDDHERLAEAHRRWKEIDSDVLDVLVHNALQNGYDSKGRAHIHYDAILDARGVAKMTKVQDGKTYTKGHRVEDRDAIHLSILRLLHMGAAVTSEPQATRSRGVSIPTVIVVYAYKYRHSSSKAPIGISYALGDWTHVMTKGETSLSLLKYDSSRQIPERRVGKLLALLLGDSPCGLVTKPIAEIVGETRFNLAGPNKGRTIRRLEIALDALVRDEIIGAWRYDPDQRAHPFPARGLMEDWLRRDLVVSRPRLPLANDPRHTFPREVTVAR